MLHTSRRLQLWVLLACAALSGACSTPMPLSSSTKSLDLSQQSIVLFILEQTRAHGRTMPWPRLVSVVDNSTGNAQLIKVDATFMDYGKDSRQYVTPLRLALKPGRYSLGAVHGTIQFFPLAGSFFTPLGLGFEVPARSVVYLGRVCAHMRPRTDNEYRAGSLIPLVSQAVLEISTSTFDVEVKDTSAFDLPLFRESFPVLASQDIKTQILPQQDRLSLDREYGATSAPASPPTACMPAAPG